jgi:hypothetical protein
VRICASRCCCCCCCCSAVNPYRMRCLASLYACSRSAAEI